MQRYLDLVIPSIYQTLIMVAVASALSILVGLILGIILVITRKEGVAEQLSIYNVLSRLMDGIRSIPFIVLLIFMLPFTKWVTGTGIGIRAAILPLFVAAAPFFGRLTESALLEVSPGVIEAALSMGADLKTLIKVMLSEAKPSLVRAGTNLIINLVGYSAMAGVVGAGGLGDLAIRYGYHRYQFDIMVITVIILYILVMVIQFIGSKWANSLERK